MQGCAAAIGFSLRQDEEHGRLGDIVKNGAGLGISLRAVVFNHYTSPRIFGYMNAPSEDYETS